MKVPLSWLRQFIDINLSPAHIAKMLTMAGLEVDSIETISPGFEKVVVVKILEVVKHPEADNLRIATVFDGENKHQVVCGAPNCRPEIKTAFATVGASVRGEDGKSLKIKKSKIRGIESFGMLCSGEELGISRDADGIVEFSDQLLEGADVAEMYGDVVLDISLTPNLGHCASIIGIARELSALTGASLRYPIIHVEQEAQDPISRQVNVHVFNNSSCPRYACRLIKNVTVQPSPDWMQTRLISCGLRPINNVVDITNYVLLEMGHPLHAFDFDLLEGREIVIKDAVEGETFITLDGKEKTLYKHDLMICDKSKPVAIAGIMGGANSEVSEKTTTVLLEAACFLPSSIRKTSKRLGLQTDSSRRFERGTDPKCLSLVLDRAAMLLQELAGGSVCEGFIDINSQSISEKQVTCRLSRINKILGTHLGVSEVESIFSRLQFTSSWDSQDIFTVKVPSFRLDINEEIDLIEEVARIYGFDNITVLTPRFHASVLPNSPIFVFERDLRNRLISSGLQEFLTCDLIGPSLLAIAPNDLLPPEALIQVLNPTSIEQSVLRTSLLPSLLQVVKHNWDRQIHDISGFEIGKIHFRNGDQYKEQLVAGIVLTGKRRPEHWGVKAEEVDFYDLKGILENLLHELNIHSFTFKENSLECFHPGRRASIFINSLEVGSIGEIHPSAIRRLDVSQRIFFAELNLHDLFKVRDPVQKMKELPIYPGSERDLTLTVDEDLSYDRLLSAIPLTSSKLLEKISLLDIYRSEKIGVNKKNVTLRFYYRDLLKTVSQEKVDAEHERIVAKLQTNPN